MPRKYVKLNMKHQENKYINKSSNQSINMQAWEISDNLIFEVMDK